MYRLGDGFCGIEGHALEKRRSWFRQVTIRHGLPCRFSLFDALLTRLSQLPTAHSVGCADRRERRIAMLTHHSTRTDFRMIQVCRVRL